MFAGAIIALLLLPFVADVYILYLASVTAVYLIIALMFYFMPDLTRAG